MIATTGRARFLDGPMNTLAPLPTGLTDGSGEAIVAALPHGNYSLRPSETGVNLIRSAAPAGGDEEAVLREVNRRNRERHGLPPAGGR